MAHPKLEAYNSKRDFTRTSEPAGGSDPGGSTRFVIHKHDATANHYDLRLEHDGVLLSWAVPKGPSLDPKVKRYAVETEPHPLEYIDFEDVIPKGQYGAGPMIVWDAGEWAPMGDIEAGLRKGDFKFRLHGQKLQGGWVLVRMKPKPGDKKTNWLLIKEKDATVDAKTDITAERPESIKSGLTTEELVARSQAATPTAKPAGRAARTKKPEPAKAKGAVKAAMPQTFKPQLASQLKEPPKGSEWIHEIKFDGYRTLAHVTKGNVQIMTRAGLDWTARYGVLADAFRNLPCDEAIIDGEIVVVDEAGVSHFADLQQALSEKAGDRLTFFAFDLVHLDGYDLTKVRLVERKELLRSLLAPVAGPASAIHFSDHVGEGAALYEQAIELGLEGILSKRADSPYVQARSKTWVKVKSVLSADFAIAGYTASTAAGGLGALALGEWVDGELEYRGNVGTGFDRATIEDLVRRLKPLESPDNRLDRMPRDVIPVRPVLTAHIHYANLTADNSVRHAVFKGLRAPEMTAAASDAPPRKRFITDADLAGIFVTNPTRRLFGRNGPTKLDLAVYYAAVGDFMLPHLLGRPVTLIRSPSGRADDIFYQRHPFNGMPASVGVFELKKSDDEDRRYLSIEDAKGYLALAQFGVVEFHTWGCRRDDIEHPDRVTFDLDPGEGMSWRNIVAAALAVRKELEARGLNALVKTSGGKGIHVVVPLKPTLDWKAAHAATGVIATEIAAAFPDTFTSNMAKNRRTKRIFIDFHRNARSATAASAYSLRARTNLPASAPVNWGDLDSIDAPEDLNYSTLPGFLNESGDPWASIDDLACDLAAAVKRLKR